MNRHWIEDAACRNHPQPRLWYTDQCGRDNPDTQRAVAVCRTCPVQVQCLDHAQRRPEIHGIWGGLTPNQRRDLRRNHREDRTA